MITAKPLSPQQNAAAGPVRWQALWRDAIRDPQELLALLGLRRRGGGSRRRAV